MDRVYQAGRIKRRRTRHQVEQLEAQILDVLRADHPQSVRHLFYRMTNPRLPEPVEKSEAGYSQVQHRIAEMRRAGRLPYHWITDATRRGYHVATYLDGANFLRDVSRQYRSDIWRDADVYCEVWVESRSIAGVIERDCERLAVSLYPAGGFTSMTLAYQSAEYIKAVVAGRPAIIFYIGDLDPAGVLIDRDIETKLRDHLGGAVELDFRRLGVTAEQVIEYDLPAKPRKIGDRRALHIRETVEAEAIPAGVLRNLLSDAIEALLPVHAVEVARIEEQSMQDYFAALANTMEA